MLVIPAEAGIQREFLLILSQFENIYHEFVIPAEAGIQGSYYKIFLNLKSLVSQEKNNYSRNYMKTQE